MSAEGTGSTTTQKESCPTPVKVTGSASIPPNCTHYPANCIKALRERGAGTAYLNPYKESSLTDNSASIKEGTPTSQLATLHTILGEFHKSKTE